MPSPSPLLKNVLVLTPVLLLGGTEIQMLSMVRILVKNGYHVAVCCYYEYDSHVVDDFQSAGAKVELLKLDRSSGKSKSGEIAVLVRSLLSVMNSHRGSIVHVEYVAPGLVPVIVSKISGVQQIFATIHYPRHGLGIMELLFVRLAARLCDVFICNSAATERSWFGGSKPHDATLDLNSYHCTIYNAVDNKKISLLSSSIHKNAKKREMGIGGEKIIGIVGRLRSEKGHEFLFSAMVNVLHSFPSVRLLLVGDGPDKIRLHAIAAELGIEKSIVWAGPKTQDETFSLYGIMDIVVVPSQFEGFGLAAAEAMAAGLAVVASDVDGLRDVVDDNSTGILVPYNDSRKLSEAILHLLNNDALSKKMGAAGHEKAALQFSLSQYESSLLAVYGRYAQAAK
jgi:L-malate glycosyltransferase